MIPVKNCLYCCIVILVIFLCSCREEAPDINRSVFGTATPELNSFDVWLRQNYVAPYNIQVYYRLRDVETDFGYDVIPADLQKAKPATAKGQYLRRVTLSSTMGPGVVVDQSSLSASNAG